MESDEIKAIFRAVEALIEQRLREAYQRGYEDCLTDEVKKK